MSILASFNDHPGPPPGRERMTPCEHNRLRFVWRIFSGKNQPKRYGFQCIDCGSSGYKTRTGAMTSQWVADRNCMEYFGENPADAVSIHDELTENLKRARDEFYARRHEERHATAWWDWYSRYLESGSWRQLRKRVFERDQFKCQSCPGNAEQVHHLTYQRVGYEAMEDLISVCRSCHEQIHGGMPSPAIQHPAAR